MQNRSARDPASTPVGPVTVPRLPLSLGQGPRIKSRYPTVTAAFYHHAETRPHVTAARDLSARQTREITYGDLAARANQLSRKLTGLGVKPGDRVPLVVKRGIDMLVGIVAVLSCGAQYVPLDGGVVPDSTLRFVLEQAGGKHVLCLQSTKHRFETLGCSCETLVIDEVDMGESQETPQALVCHDLAEPEHGCYVIYTSGKSRRQSGWIEMGLENVTNLVCLSPGDLGISTGTRVSQVLNISFDMAAWEILGCICNGGTLILRGSNWEPCLREVQVLICTPSILAKYDPREYSNIKVAATAGEPSSQRLADLWATHATYYNCCGPTETTIVNTMHLHQPGESLTIGKPTPNNTVYVLDSDGKPLGVGEPGVMWAGGHGISRGYVSLPEKTAERYRLDPFTKDGSLMYNTGDLGRWRQDGSIDILGRVDDQIKIKGFRVELDGVTASINTCPAVSKAATLFVHDEIHGFVTPRDCDLDAVQVHVRALQPYYAIPTKFHFLDALPLTANGKVDKRALQDLATPTGHTEKDEKEETSVTVRETQTTGGSTASLSADDRTAESSSAPSFADSDEKPDLGRDVPAKTRARPYRGLVHRVAIVYRRLFTLVGALNIAAAVALASVSAGFPRAWLGTLTAVNLLVAVLARQDLVVNALYALACNPPRSWPLAVRKRCANIFHLGGVHSGAAVSAGAWLLAANVGDAVCQLAPECPAAAAAYQSTASKVVSWMLTGLFAVTIALAWPAFRKTHHDLFEKTHRFVGWTMLALFWVQIVLGADDGRAAADTSLGAACIRTPGFWILIVATVSIASSWLFLKKVPVEAEVLSDHAVRLHFGYTVPVNGSFVRLSRRPLLEWHSFATIPAPEPVEHRPRGFSLVVSNAGDWTKHCIERPPTHIWVRGLPTCGVMRIATCFNRVVVIATGSGIGPLLGHIQDQSCPTQLIWSTRQPEQTFGRPLLDAIKAKIPAAVIHDTKTMGRPDLVKMGYNLAKSFRAEAVIIIANEKITKKVVYGLETRGVPAYGAIWDS
ncbi:Linear gramicidin synthase subunit C [Colletotrichum tanaceti]|uniref:Linear gramicidin synthase subunit C n=1 Tax=Colletotrichum tanaceti TaxID=1306861 RepID=A0A4V6Y9L1_9PEZI|nr:Linear gramicidin synthase subunit C [Colletotrichum tanaceti]TKW58906.1 Linear gramicidin synthase subunit C [Colletotrichum tanaceti]